MSWRLGLKRGKNEIDETRNSGSVQKKDVPLKRGNVKETIEQWNVFISNLQNVDENTTQKTQNYFKSDLLNLGYHFNKGKKHNFLKRKTGTPFFMFSLFCFFFSFLN